MYNCFYCEMGQHFAHMCVRWLWKHDDCFILNFKQRKFLLKKSHNFGCIKQTPGEVDIFTAINGIYISLIDIKIQIKERMFKLHESLSTIVKQCDERRRIILKQMLFLWRNWYFLEIYSTILRFLHFYKFIIESEVFGHLQPPKWL